MVLLGTDLITKTGKAPYGKKELLGMYEALVKPRMIEEKMLLLLRQGRVSKWFSGIGQEAISVGATLALKQDEYILPLHRNLGVFTVRNCPLDKLIAQWQGKVTGYTKGRDRSFHFGTNDEHIVGMISHLGPQLSVADGIALASKLNKEKKVTLTFSGEGGTSEGEFHEALNVAAVWDLPVIFMIENNGYGLSTPSSDQYRCKTLADRASGYGIEGVTIDGNDLFTVYETVKKYAEDIRKKPRAVLIECMTFRMRGHEEASGTKYVPKHLFEEWAKKDPILRFESQLQKKFGFKKVEFDQVRNTISVEIEQAIEKAFSEAEPVANSEAELSDVYREANFTPALPSAKRTQRRFVDAVSDGLNEAMTYHQNLILMGQDIADYGGVFKVTDGFLKKYGAERVRNTPLCESAILGAALGLSIKGYKSVVEMQFADFVSCGFTQIINNLAKSHYRWGQNADVVVRMPTGAGSGAGPFHSQSNEAWFAHTPGLKVVYPSTPSDAKGLLLASIEDPNPVIYFEHKALYRSSEEEVPDGYYTVPIGRARIVKEGTAATIITYGMGVRWAEKLAEESGISLYILDLRSLLPLDYEAICEAVAKTNRVIVLHEDTMFGGIGGEIAAYITEHCFQMLDAPVMRVAGLDTPIPFASPLEKNFLANSRLNHAVQKILEF